MEEECFLHGQHLEMGCDLDCKMIKRVRYIMLIDGNDLLSVYVAVFSFCQIHNLLMGKFFFLKKKNVFHCVH
jgi:hypothetical protein